MPSKQKVPDRKNEPPRRQDAKKAFLPADISGLGPGRAEQGDCDFYGNM
jgi:hypothetical protein